MTAATFHFEADEMFDVAEYIRHQAKGLCMHEHYVPSPCPELAADESFRCTDRATRIVIFRDMNDGHAEGVQMCAAHAGADTDDEPTVVIDL